MIQSQPITDDINEKLEETNLLNELLEEDINNYSKEEEDKDRNISEQNQNDNQNLEIEYKIEDEETIKNDNNDDKTTDKFFLPPLQSTKPTNEQSESADELEMTEFLRLLSQIKEVKILKSNDNLSLEEMDEILYEIVKEEELETKSLNLAIHGYELLISGEKYKSVLELRHAENIISTQLFARGEIKQNVVLFTLINLGVAYYRMGFLEESLVCFENCLVTINQSRLGQNGTTQKQQQQPWLRNQNQFFSTLPQRFYLLSLK